MSRRSLLLSIIDNDQINGVIIAERRSDIRCEASRRDRSSRRRAAKRSYETRFCELNREPCVQRCNS